MEIAEVIKLSDSAVDALLQRAKKNLQKILKNYYTLLQ
jgi:DNA-directed RNA polymerase specialized sigma24 family protein